MWSSGVYALLASYIDLCFSGLQFLLWGGEWSWCGRSSTLCSSVVRFTFKKAKMKHANPLEYETFFLFIIKQAFICYPTELLQPSL
jgi:hypothetical protein